VGSANEGEERRWCAGLPEVATRELTDEERATLELWFAEPRARARVYGWFLRITFLLWPAICFFFLWDDLQRGQEIKLGLVVFASLGGFMMAAGLISGVAEIVMGISRGARLTFIALALGVILSAATSEPGELGDSMFPGALMAFGLVGLVFMGIRFFRRRDSVRILREVDQGLSANTVVRFAGEIPSVDGDTPTEAAIEKHEMEVLVPSGIVLHVDGDRPVEPVQLEVFVLAGPGLPPVSAPLTAFEALPPKEGWEYRQRHLTSAEVSEVRKLSRRVLVRGFLGSVGAFWLIGVVVTNADRLFHRGLTANPRWEAFALSAVIPILMLFYAAYQAWLLRRDAEMALLVVAKKWDRSIEAELSEEILPSSNRLWTVNGVPGEWRPEALSTNS
jgi:hypothetical protein